KNQKKRTVHDSNYVLCSIYLTTQFKSVAQELYKHGQPHCERSSQYNEVPGESGSGRFGGRVGWAASTEGMGSANTIGVWGLNGYTYGSSTESTSDVSIGVEDSAAVVSSAGADESSVGAGVSSATSVSHGPIVSSVRVTNSVIPFEISWFF